MLTTNSPLTTHQPRNTLRRMPAPLVLRGCYDRCSDMTPEPLADVGHDGPMRLVSFVRDGTASWGAATDGGVVDLQAALGGRVPTVRALLAGDGLGAAADALAAAGAAGGGSFRGPAVFPPRSPPPPPPCGRGEQQRAPPGGGGGGERQPADSPP